MGARIDKSISDSRPEDSSKAVVVFVLSQIDSPQVRKRMWYTFLFGRLYGGSRPNFLFTDSVAALHWIMATVASLYNFDNMLSLGDYPLYYISLSNLARAKARQRFDKLDVTDSDSIALTVQTLYGLLLVLHDHFPQDTLAEIEAEIEAENAKDAKETN